MEFWGPYFEFLVLQVHGLCVLCFTPSEQLFGGVLSEGMVSGTPPSPPGSVFVSTSMFFYCFSVFLLQILFRFCVFHSKLCMCVIVLFLYFIWFHSHASHTSLRIYTGNILELPFFPFALYSLFLFFHAAGLRMPLLIPLVVFFFLIKKRIFPIP